MNKSDYKKSRISVLREILTEYLRLLNYVLINISDNFSTMEVIYAFIVLCLLSMALAVIFRKLKK